MQLVPITNSPPVLFVGRFIHPLLLPPQNLQPLPALGPGKVLSHQPPASLLLLQWSGVELAAALRPLKLVLASGLELAMDLESLMGKPMLVMKAGLG